MSSEPLVRPARPGDGASMGRSHVKAWQVGYPHIFPAAFLDGLDPVERGEQWEARINSGSTDGKPPGDELPSVTVVGEIGGEVLGLCTYGPYRAVEGQPPEEAASAGLCELWGLNVHPDAWGSGLAQALMVRTLAGLGAEHPQPTAVLWVLADNARGRRFYHKEGWGPDGVEQSLTIGQSEVAELRYAIDLGPYR